MSKKNNRADIKIAWISFWGVILVAIIGVIAASFKKSDKTHQFQNVGDVNLTYNLPFSVTDDAIKKLEDKLKQTEEKIEFSKKDIGAIANALKDLDQRTSGIKKLPDGRTEIGIMRTGSPVVVFGEHSQAVSYYIKQDFKNAFKHSQNAINAFEETKKISQARMVTGDLQPQDISKMYVLGAVIAQKLSENMTAHLYAKKAVDAEDNAKNKALLSTTLASLGKYQEAIEFIDKAMEQEPQNEYYANLKKKYVEKLQTKKP